MDHDKPAQRRNHGADLFPRGVVRSNGRTDGNSPVLGDLGSDVSDASNVEVAMFTGKTKLGGQMLPDKIAIKKCNWPAPDFVEFDQQNVGNGRFAGAGQASEENGEPLLVARREAPAQFLYDFGIGKPVRDETPFVEP